MKSLKKVMLTFVASIGLIGAVYAFPHGPGHSGLHGKQGEFFMELISAKLDLTVAQENKLSAIRAKLQSMYSSVREERMSKQQQMMGLITAPTLDQQAVVSLIDNQVASHRAQVPEVIAVIAEFTDSLDIEQKQALADLLSKRFHEKAKHH